jgi:Protein of unknown function (DUF551)
METKTIVHCNNCKNCKVYTTGGDEYPAHTTLSYCEKGHWENGSVDELTNETNVWGECQDFESKICGEEKKNVPVSEPIGYLCENEFWGALDILKNHLNRKGINPIITPLYAQPVSEPRGWISVTKNPPEKLQAILVEDESGRVFAGGFYPETDKFCINNLPGESMCSMDIEHFKRWMPLPAPPAEKD